MERFEFEEKLRTALAGKVDSVVLADTMCYYSDYINSEIASGRSESEVMESLGDPRLIARSIIDAKNNKRDYIPSDDPYTEETTHDERQVTPVSHQLPTAIRAGVGMLVFFGVVVVAFKVLAWAAPTLITIGVIVLIIKIIKDLID